MEIYDFIKLLGIFSLTSLLITFALGFFKFKIKNRFLLHKIFAIITLIIALTHGLILIYLTYIK